MLLCESYSVVKCFAMSVKDVVFEFSLIAFAPTAPDNLNCLIFPGLNG